MGKVRKEAEPRSRDVDVSVQNVSRKPITIDVLCKQYSMLFASDFNKPKKIVPKPRARSARSKSKTADGTSTGVKKKLPETVSNQSSSTSGSIKVETSAKKKVKFTRKKTEVLGNLNPNSSPKTITDNTNDAKREKRKRFAGDDNDIAAENIPLEAVLPALQFGVNKGISPKKRRRLQSLISPISPNSPFPFK